MTFVSGTSTPQERIRTGSPARRPGGTCSGDAERSPLLTRPAEPVPGDDGPVLAVRQAPPSPAGGRRDAVAAKAPLDRHTVVIADGDPLSRRVVRDALQAGTPFVVAAEASDGVEAVELARHYRPDIVLMELALPRLDGMSAIRRIRAEAGGTRVVVFSIRADEDLELDAIRAGACGFVAKDAGTAGAVAAMHVVLDGDAAISSSLTMRLVERLRDTPEPGHGLRPVHSTLTTREWEVLDLMSGGASTAGIAAKLVLAEDTVYSHVKNIMRKLGVHSRPEAVRAARALLCQDAGAGTGENGGPPRPPGR